MPNVDEIQARLVVLRELGVNIPHDIDAIRRSATYEAAQQALIELKKRVNENFRRLAKDLHPDLNGGDANKTAWFTLISRMKAEIDRVQLPPPPPPRPVLTMTVAWINNFSTMNIDGTVTAPFIPPGATRIK